MLYVRGNQLDYDRWQELGAAGWNSSAMNPYFVKMEDSRDSKREPGYHGTKGPMTISELNDPFEADTAILEGAREYGFNIGDYNGADQMRFQYGSHYIRDGRRCSTGRGYLGPASSRRNLDILLHSRADKIIFNGKRAIGVAFTSNKKDYQVFARNAVIISTGAIATPQLLMLSGIGPKDQLEKFNIPIVHESPGVGNNLQDHLFTLLLFRTNYGTSFAVERVDTVKSLVEYETSHTGPFASSGLNVNGFWRSKYADDSRPDIQFQAQSISLGNALSSYYLSYLFNINRETYVKYVLPNTNKDATIILVTLVRPRNTGTIKLASSDIKDSPLIDFNFFTDPRDLDATVEGCKLFLNISKTEAMKSVGAERFDSPLPGCEQYPLDSDDYLRCLMQTLTFTLWHSIGTAKMGSRGDPMAVVSPDLLVHGVENLMVIDTSVMPEITTGNTATPTIAIAERAADMIKGRVLRPQSLPFTDEDDIISDYVPYRIDHSI
ncbi:glucose dehydrogenase [FAD, quinone]-like [Tetranychus urticae]|nr:glucose dehydrogenase [FAD, quinone]-like [Tetranychus urticae]